MTNIERMSWAWREHIFLDPDTFPGDESSMIRATYRVEDLDKMLIVRAHWAEPTRNETVEPMLLQMLDEAAQWEADHPGVRGFALFPVEETLDTLGTL